VVSMLELVGWGGGGKPKYLYHKMCTFFELKLGQHPSPSIWACRHCLPDFFLSQGEHDVAAWLQRGRQATSMAGLWGYGGCRGCGCTSPVPLCPGVPGWSPGLPSLLLVVAHRRWQQPILCGSQAWGEALGFALLMPSSRSASPLLESPTHQARLPSLWFCQAV